MRCSLILVLSLLTTVATAAPPSLTTALELLDQAIAKRETDPAQSASLASSSAALLASEEFATPEFYHALGSAHLLAGDNGHAVLAFRRGLDQAPTDHRLQQSLGFARSSSGASEHSVSPTWAEWCAGWITRSVPTQILLWIGITLTTAGFWILAISALAGRRVRALWTSCFGLAAGAFIPWGIPLIVPPSGDAVLLESSLAFAGPNKHVFEPAFESELVAGTEARVLEHREGWVRCEFGVSQGWLPVDSIGFVREEGLARR